MKALLVGFIKIYQKWVSPMFPPRCKYYPSCSSYAATAIYTHGIKGIFMAMWRLLRCNPWSYGGVDYVPNAKPSIKLQTPISTLVRKGETQ